MISHVAGVHEKYMTKMNLSKVVEKPSTVIV